MLDFAELVQNNGLMNEAHDWLWCWHNVYNACGQTSTCPLGQEEQIDLGGSQFYYQVLPECGNSITQSPKSRCPRSWITIGSHRWGCIQRFSCHTHRARLADLEKSTDSHLWSWSGHVGRSNIGSRIRNSYEGGSLLHDSQKQWCGDWCWKHMVDYGWQGPTLWQAADLTTTAGRKWLLEDIIGLTDARWKILKLERVWRADSVTYHSCQHRIRLCL